MCVCMCAHVCACVYMHVVCMCVSDLYDEVAAPYYRDEIKHCQTSGVIVLGGFCL